MSPERTDASAQPVMPGAAGGVESPWDLGCKSSSLENQPEDPCPGFSWDVVNFLSSDRCVSDLV